MRVTYVGHSTVLIATDGIRLLTDPILRGRVVHLRRKGTVSAEVLEDIDAVLISHMHMDHLDPPSIQRLGRDVQLVVPRGAAPLLRRKRFRHIIELAEGEDVTIGGVTVTATHADHEGDRLPFGASASAVGYRIAGERSVYFAGDTDLFEGMEEIGRGGLDVALLPIAGWGPKLPPGHLTPTTAAQALARLRPRVAIPIHWGTLAPMTSRAGAPGHSDEPAAAFVAQAAELAPGVEVRVLAPGDSTEV